MSSAPSGCVIAALLVVLTPLAACSSGDTGHPPSSRSPVQTSGAPSAPQSPSTAPSAPASGPASTPTVAKAQLRYRHGIAVPDPHVTPSSTLRGVTTSQVCSRGWNADHKKIPFAVQNSVSARYGVLAGKGTTIRLDQLVPASLGGDATVRNVWPQPADGSKPGWKTKNALESHLHRLVCRDGLPLRTAQRAIGDDWPAALRKYPPSS